MTFLPICRYADISDCRYADIADICICKDLYLHFKIYALDSEFYSGQDTHGQTDGRTNERTDYQ